MAKKKPTHIENSTQNQENSQQIPSLKMEPNQEQPPIAAMEDPIEKLSSLKNLNAMLLKETVEKRKEVDALLESKKSLESELTRSESEIEALKAELTRATEVEVGKEVVSAFVESQVVGVLRKEKEELEKENEGLVREKEEVVRRLGEVERELGVVVKERDEIEKAKVEKDSEIGSMKKLESELRVQIEKQNVALNESIREKDGLKSDFDALLEEKENLKAKLSEVEDRIRESAEKLKEFESKYEVATNGLEVSERNAESLRVELGSIGVKCEELQKEIEGLNSEKESIMREKDELHRERNVLEGRIGELEKELSYLNSTILVFKGDEEKWRVNSAELEKSNAEMGERVEELEGEVRALLEEKKEKDSEIEGLVEEKSTALKMLGELRKELRSMKRAKEEILEDRNGLELVKLRQESEIAELHEKVNELESLKNALEQAKAELDEAKNALEEEKINGAMLQVKVSEISKKLEESLKVIEGLRASENTLVAEKKELEEKHSILTEDKASISKELRDAWMKTAELESSMKSRNDMFEWALTMLKNTALQLSMASEKNGESEGIAINNEEEMKPYLDELEAIRAAFRSREEKVGEMLEQLEKLQFSVVEAKKKKSFWTVVSSATTILAAVVSFAYAARVR